MPRHSAKLTLKSRIEKHNALQMQAAEIESRLVILDDLIQESGGNPLAFQPSLYATRWQVYEHVEDWDLTLSAWVTGRDTELKIKLTLDEAALLAQRLTQSVERQRASQEKVMRRRASEPNGVNDLPRPFVTPPA